jgi:hypothetical protein
MRRRDFIKVIVGSAAAWPLGTRAQEPGRIYRVALIVPVGRDEPAIIAFLDELRSQGFVEGENLIVVPGFLAKNEQVGAIVPATIQAAPDALAAQYHLPAILPDRRLAVGALISYGSIRNDALRLAAGYAGRILKGEKPTDLPVQQATKVELVINLKTAKTLGITIPLSLLGRADEVIE